MNERMKLVDLLKDSNKINKIHIHQIDQVAHLHMKCVGALCMAFMFSFSLPLLMPCIQHYPVSVTFVIHSFVCKAVGWIIDQQTVIRLNINMFCFGSDYILIHD